MFPYHLLAKVQRRYNRILTVSKWNAVGYGEFTGENLEREQRISELRNQVQYTSPLKFTLNS
jgi:hypothetical protein